jgi:hypothetical protein
MQRLDGDAQQRPNPGPTQPIEREVFHWRAALESIPLILVGTPVLPQKRKRFCKICMVCSHSFCLIETQHEGTVQPAILRDYRIGIYGSEQGGGYPICA